MTLDGASNGTGDPFSPLGAVSGKRSTSEPSGPMTAIWLVPTSAA
jgi:hypothetical protein